MTIENETHCIVCGNELDINEEGIGVGICTSCIEEACKDYYAREVKEYLTKNKEN